MSMNQTPLKNIIESAMLAAGQPLSIDRMLSLFMDDQQPSRDEIREALTALESDYEGRGVELKEVANGYRIQIRTDVAPWVARLWDERPPRYSRALLETLALIAYRQPITRAEIEEVRGVAVSSNIIKTLLEREWIRVIGHRDVPGKPALYATTREFLDYFNLKSLDELPSLMELRDIDSINAELNLELPSAQLAPANEEGEGEEGEESQTELLEGAADEDREEQVEVSSDEEEIEVTDIAEDQPVEGDEQRSTEAVTEQ